MSLIITYAFLLLKLKGNSPGMASNPVSEFLKTEPGLLISQNETSISDVAAILEESLLNKTAIRIIN